MKKNLSRGHNKTLKVSPAVQRAVKQAASEHNLKLYEITERGCELAIAELEGGIRPQWVLPVEDEGVKMMWQAKTEDPEAYAHACRTLRLYAAVRRTPVLLPPPPFPETEKPKRTKSGKRESEKR